MVTLHATHTRMGEVVNAGWGDQDWSVIAKIIIGNARHS